MNKEPRLENAQAQMRKGILEYCILLVIAKGPAYASDILEQFKATNLIVVEGTIYPLLSRLKRAQYLEYSWVESVVGPPRKYYRLTDKGHDALRQMADHWVALTTSVNALRDKLQRTHSATSPELSFASTRLMGRIP